MNYHLVGVGGIGMSAIARILLARNETVSGSDIAETALVRQLRDEGVHVYVGHRAENVRGAKTVVVSSAIDRRNPEYVAAMHGGITVLRRGEMLARLLDGRRGIAVCGTHGKTTTTAMVHAALRASGIDAGLVLGGIDLTLQSNAHEGSAPWFVTEADESDGSFALLEPVMAIVTNLENDHLTSDDELPALARAFGEFLGKLPDDGYALIGIDNPLSASLTGHELAAAVETFGLDGRASLRAVDVTYAGIGSSFDVYSGDRHLGRIELRVPGAMNVANALGAIGIAHRLGCSFAGIAAALRAFRGVRRRFDVLVSGERATVVDDYAHHPTAVRATIAAARRYHHGPLVVAFQPHRFTRTAFLARDFADALGGADRIYLAPVYAASEPAIPGVSERSIGEPLAAAGADVRYVDRVDDLERKLMNELPQGAMLLMLGAGDITDVAARLAGRLSESAAATSARA